MHRVYMPLPAFTENILISDSKEIHHIKNVLRMKQGEGLVLFNGKGEEATGKIAILAANQITVAISGLKKFPKREPTIILACAMPKKSKFETIIEKATELGVSEIIPLQARRSDVKIKAEDIGKKTARFQSVAVNAAKQSKRADIPHIYPPMTLEESIAKLEKRCVLLIPSLSGNRKSIFAILPALKPTTEIAVFIGPEGDFTPEEYKFAWEKGCLPITLGPTTLKVETAALASVSCIAVYFAKHV